jgi:hypothetical protein
VAAAVVDRGIKTDEYSPLPAVDYSDRSKAVTALMSAIPHGPGVTVDDALPYPVVGWLELRHTAPQAIAATEGTAVGGLKVTPAHGVVGTEQVRSA